MKYKLRLKLLENIIQSADEGTEKLEFIRMKKEAEEFLKFHNEKLSSENFKCTLAGCLFECNRHREYVRHLQRVHPRESNLGCQFGLSCRQAFANLGLLKDHISQAHQKKSSTLPEQSPAGAVNVPCRCSISKCGGAQFSNLKTLMLHLRNYHAKADEMVSCIFEDCSSKYDKATTLRNHFNKVHFKAGKLNLKKANKVLLPEVYNIETDESQNLDDAFLDDGVEPNDQFMEEEEEGLEGIEDMEDDAEPEVIDDVFMMAYCDFLNRLINYQFIPQSSVQLISEEYLKNYLKANEVKTSVLRNSLLKNIPGISEVDIRKILEDVAENDPFLKAQISLDTDYKRLKYLKENFTYVEPVEIVFNIKEVKAGLETKALMHYIPVVQTIKNLVQDSTFLEVSETNIGDTSESVLRDVKDGLIYKTNKYFIDNPDALCLFLYSDAVELVNPLGAGRGKHKVIQIFLTLAEIPRTQRSKIDRIQLVGVVKEKVVKQFGFKKVYRRLVENLTKLEEGVTVHHPVQRLVKCGLLLHPSDNLEAHCVGGFSQSFSSLDICRFCHIQYNDLHDNIHNYGSKQHRKWTREEYDRAAAAQVVEERNRTLDESHDEDDNFEADAGVSLDSSISDTDSSADEETDESGPEEQELFGIKHRYPLNVLKAFHSTSGFPVDILHDIFEGVVSQDLLGIIRILKVKGWFSIQEYNTNMKNHNTVV